MRGFYHEGQWIPRTGGPFYAECPVCKKVYPWKTRTCPTCAVVLLALYTGDWRVREAEG